MAKDIKKSNNKSKKNVKNQPASRNSVGISTKSYKPGRTAATANNAKAPSQTLISKNTLISRIMLIAVCAAVLVATVWLIIYFVIDSYHKNFDYLEYNMNDYIELAESDYKNYTLMLDIAKPHLKADDGTGVSDVDIRIMSILTSKMVGDNDPIGPRTEADVELALGDDVYLWYRGYIIKDGREVELDAFSNFYKDTDGVVADASVHTIGSGRFNLAGLDAGLIGVNTGDIPRFVKIKSGQVNAGQVVYISCEKTPVGGKSTDKLIGSCVRINLSDEEVAAEWEDVLVGKTIGAEEALADFKIKEDGVEYNYTKTKILFATECEGEDRLTIETYAPYDHLKESVRNETVYLDVYVEAMQRRNPWHTENDSNPDAEYELSYDWNDEVVEEMIEADKLDISMEALLKYEGESLTERYESFTYDELIKDYEEKLEELTEDEMWNYYLSKVKVKQYPQTKVDAVYREYYDDLEYKYSRSGGIIYNPVTLSNKTCSSLDEYAVIYYNLQLSKDQDWRAYLRGYAEDLVVERLILFYIMKKENLTPKADVFNKKYVELRQEYVDEYIKQDTTDTSDYDKEEYAEYVKECENRIFSYFSEDYFKETTYYELVVDALIKYPVVKTLDDVPMSQRK